MKITALETIQLTDLPNFLWLQVHTDAGLVGLGECQREPDAVAAYLHSAVAPYLLGKDPELIERHNAHLAGPYLGFESTGAEIRAASAVDIALWDIAGQAVGRPIHALLGGLARDSIAVYNTCAGYDYNRGKQRRLVMPGDRTAAPEGPYDDQVAFMNAPAELAASLIDEGFAGMKIWPFDPWAAATGGAHIALDHLKQGVAAFEAIRRAVGDRIELMCELHSLWNLPSARRIAKALEPYGLYWIEDPLNRMNNVAGLAELAAATPIAIAGGETLASPALYRDLLNARALAVVIADIGWCGGISKARRIAALAEAYQRPIALHDCSGPVVLTASVHLSLSLSNALFQEVVRAFVTGWYGSLVTELPRIARGHIHPMAGAGLGTRLKDSVLARPDLVRRRSALS